MFNYGVDYYPEHWSEERWPVDAGLMQAAGFNVVRLAEFAWSRLEPQDGCFDFGWLDRAIEVLAAHGLRIILGTPTASAPPWLLQNHPDIFRVLESGMRQSYGNRRNYCPNNPTYHEYTRRIVAGMAEHYHDNPHVIGWQTDNEYAQGDRCCCENCRGAFGHWLRERYGSLDELNRQWGSVFWSHIYNDWSEIPAPLKTGMSPNPGLALDYFRFSSDSYVHYQKLAVDILREKCPNHFLTHNFMGFGFGQLNYFDLASDLDLVAYDIYPRTQWNMTADVHSGSNALGHDTMRGLKRKNHWVMEQQAGPGGWEIVSVAPRPGEIRLWAYQSIAHGADGVIYFRWRTALFGSEEYWHGILDHHAIPGRRYEEVMRMGQELLKVGERIHGSETKARVALLNDYDARWAFQIQANNPQFDYPRHFQQWYDAFHRRSTGMDVIAALDDLSQYGVVVAPALHVVTPAVAENLRRYVESGGTLLLTARSGVKNQANDVIDKPLPGLLSEIAGVEVEEYDSFAEGMSNPLRFCLPGFEDVQVKAAIWADVLRPTTAETLAVYTRDYYAGRAAITVNTYGAGRVIYVGVLGEAALFDVIGGWALKQAGVHLLLKTPPGVEVTARYQGDSRLLFVLNHTAETQTITLDAGYRNLLDGAVLRGERELPAREVWVLEKAA
ncbi:MAG TPA: beta-galactosidase [Levilinea sp.]|nr:beta-galactosidase [Levilinea sp.]